MRKASALSAVLLVFLCAGFASVAQAAEYYLSETGDDANAGSREAPWRTFVKANSSVKPGDTVRVLPGHYEGAKLNAKGTAEAPITYVSSERHKAVVDLGGFPSSATEGSRISIWGDYTVFDGFEVSTGRAESGRAANAAVAVYRCKGTVVRNCHCHTNDRWGIFTAWAAELTLENNECHNNRREHGIYVSNGGDNPCIIGNRCYDNGGCGIQINTDRGTIHGAILEKNILWDNNKSGGQSINFDGVAQAVVRNNVIIIDRRNGIALYQIDGGEISHDNLIVNNTFINLGGSSGILFNDGAHSNVVFNNVMWSRDPARAMMEGNIEGNVISNNAFSGKAFGDGAVKIGDDAAALFVDPDSRDFNLKAGSPLVDAGLNTLENKKAPREDFTGAWRPSGAAIDIGAYEFKEGVL
jgi:hypothetical protein